MNKLPTSLIVENKLHPIMSQEEFDSYPETSAVRMACICNYPKCNEVVCNQGMLCVEHWIENYNLGRLDFDPDLI